MTPSRLPTHEEVHAAYQQGEEAVIAPFDGLHAVIRALEAQVQSQEDRSVRSVGPRTKPSFQAT